MHFAYRLFVGLILTIAATTTHSAEDPFAAQVRTTAPLSTEQQLESFTLPEGFEIQLVAAEPDLRKPMNMAFDSRGRLWVTESREYPIAAPTNSRPRDTVRILTDFATNGRAQSVTTFATNLNIPIGIYPFRSRSATAIANGQVAGARMSWKCIVWSIPNIWLLEDLDGNGQADTSKILYGPFDHTRDTHGNQASFRRGNDGWLYATHGFNNRSKVSGTDGHEIEMQSGNTYRMKLDGSRIEHWTHGQVNPFGMTFDMFGNLYSADCHSSPIYQLLRGAYYPSFGKPHDGLGFAPVTIRHSHGSTAIAGIVVVENPAWPDEYQGDIFVGNVMTSRINRDRVEWRGATTVGHELPDFLSCSDPWFRPVDLQWGPDGALYIADFYNRIIGHYEVPLNHPERDRERGRIWRVVYRGKPNATDSIATQPEQKANLFQSLGSPNPVQRSLALNEISDIYGRFAVGDLRKLLGSENEYRHVSALWALHRFGALSERDLLRAIISNSTLPRVHALKIAGERSQWSTNLLSIATKSLHAENGHVRHAAAAVLGLTTNANVVQPLLARLQHTPTEDTHLRHVVRMSIRNQLMHKSSALFAASAKWPRPQQELLKEIALAVDTPAAADHLLNSDPESFASDSLKDRAWKHVARHATGSTVARLITQIRSRDTLDLARQLELFNLVNESHTGASAQRNKRLNEWAAELAATTLAGEKGPALIWGNTPPRNKPDTANPWTLQQRKRSDGEQTLLLSSHPHGERLRGSLRSRVFNLPDKLEFQLCGHNGKPDTPDTKRNRVRLRDAEFGHILREAFPPRSDITTTISWDLTKLAGRSGYIEAVDGDSRGSYAWLAFGGFQPALPELKIVDASTAAKQASLGAKLVGDFNLTDLQEQVSRLLNDPIVDHEVRKNASQAVAKLNGGGLRWAAHNLLNELTLPASMRNQFLPLVVSTSEPTDAVFKTVLQSATANQQNRIADGLASIMQGADLLLGLIANGVCSPAVLRGNNIVEKLKASGTANAQQRIARFLAALPSAIEERNSQIQSRIVKYRAAKTDITKGSEVFNLACAACHQINGHGKIVGPQLDGIGNRGLDRIVEDILDPHRNVDIAFRPETITLKDGEIFVALPRSEEDSNLKVINSAGQERTLPIADITRRTPSTRSLMPDNFHEALNPDQLNNLLAYLISLR